MRIVNSDKLEQGLECPFTLDHRLIAATADEAASQAYLAHLATCPTCLELHAESSLWRESLQEQTPLRKTVPLLLRGRIAASFAKERRRAQYGAIGRMVAVSLLLLSGVLLLHHWQQELPWAEMVDLLQHQEPTPTALLESSLRGEGPLPQHLPADLSLPARFSKFPIYAWEHHVRRGNWQQFTLLRLYTPLGGAVLLVMATADSSAIACAKPPLGQVGSHREAATACWQENGYTYAVVATTTTLAEQFLPPV